MGVPTTVTNGCIVRAYIGQPAYVQVWDMGRRRIIRDNKNGTFSIMAEVGSRLTAKEVLDWVNDHAG